MSDKEQPKVPQLPRKPVFDSLTKQPARHPKPPEPPKK